MALLNTSRPEIDYQMSASEIIAAVQDAVAGGTEAIEELAMMLDIDMHGNVMTTW